MSGRGASLAARIRSHPFEVTVATVFVVLKVVYLVRALRPGDNAGYHLILGSDSPTYTNAARASIFSRDFYEAPGPFGFLLLLKLVAQNLRALVIAQTAIAIAAWLALAFSVRSAMRTRAGRWIGFAGMLAAGLAPAFVMYDVAVATESLAISLACVVLALAIRVAVRADTRTVVAFVVALTAAAFTHDINALIAGGVGVLALLALAVPRWRTEHARRLVACGLVLIVVGAVELQLSNAARRWYWPTAETLVIRISATNEGYDWLVAHGMPDDGAVRALQKNYFLTYPAFQANEPQYRALRHWLDTRGRSAYTRYLLTHPVFVVAEPRHSLADQLAPPVEPIATAQHIRPDPVTRAIGAVGLPDFRFAVAWALLAFAGLAWALVAESSRARRRIGFTIAGIAVIAVPHALAVFHGDVLELARHSLSAAVHIRVVVLLATAFAVDAFVVWRRT